MVRAQIARMFSTLSRRRALSFVVLCYLFGLQPPSVHALPRLDGKPEIERPSSEFAPCRGCIRIAAAPIARLASDFMCKLLANCRALGRTYSMCEACSTPRLNSNHDSLPVDWSVEVLFTRHVTG